MSIILKIVLLALGIAVLIGSIIWAIKEKSSYEPKLAILGAIISIIPLAKGIYDNSSEDRIYENNIKFEKKIIWVL